MAAPVHLDVLGAGGRWSGRRRETVRDVTGDPIAELSMVPSLFVHRDLDALRRAPVLPADRRAAALARAGEDFATGKINGQTPEEYQHAVSRTSGLPISVVRAASEKIRRAADSAFATVENARPVGAAGHWTDPTTRAGRAVWTRRGETFAVHAAGNSPSLHALWLEALALGYRVAVRPSRREPFTPHRLVSALRGAGFDDDQVILLPSGHDVADDIIEAADLAMVYGGDEVVGKYAGSPTVLPQGPGRSKILLAGDDWHSHLDMVVASVSGLGGTACVNTTAVFVAGDPAPVAESLAERLSALPSLPPEDDKAVLPVRSLESARALEAYVLRRAEGTKAWLGRDGIADDLGDGSAVLRPAVFEVPAPDAPQAGTELSFPCVWVAPWTPAAGVAPLRDTLVLTAVTGDEQLVGALVDEPTIRNVHIGNHPTHWFRPGVPHDGYLADFLMRTKTMIRG
jgi:acyl-CoA reductase-like NAD-dependent aldehyde dehydrogenase